MNSLVVLSLITNTLTPLFACMVSSKFLKKAFVKVKVHSPVPSQSLHSIILLQPFRRSLLPLPRRLKGS